MPRPKKVMLSTEEKIANVKKEIESLNEQIKEKRNLLKELEKQKVDEDNAKIIAAVEASGKSMDEILAMLSKPEA